MIDQLLARELGAWRAGQDLTANTQDDRLYKPGRIEDCLVAIALTAAGLDHGDPLECGRIEVLTDRFDGDYNRLGAGFDVKSAALFSESDHGQYAPEEWEARGLAFVWWRPHRRDSLLTEYRGGGPDDPRVASTGDVIVIEGPTIAGDGREGPRLAETPRLPWLAAADRQLGFFA